MARINTLGFVVHPDGERVLMVHRVGRQDDYQRGKFNGLGGKLEPTEDVVACMKREISEEAGITVTSLRLRGTVSWPGFSAQGDEFGFIFLIDGWEGEPLKANEEGPLSWRRIDELSSLPMWDGDRYFLPLVFDESVGQFHGVLPYCDGRPVSWQVSISGDAPGAHR